MRPHPLVHLAVVLAVAHRGRADTSTDAARLGEEYTTLPLYRSGAGTNVLSVGLGTPAQAFNLTLSTNVDYVMVVDTDCDSCTDNANEYDYADSSSLTTSQKALDYTFIYPSSSSEAYHLTGVLADEIITDARSDSAERPVVLVTGVGVDAQAAGGGTGGTLASGSSGFWGLGVDLSNADQSIIPSMLGASTAGTASNASYFVVGLDVANYTDLPSTDAGTMHWGAVPEGAYTGSFNWLKVNTSVGGGWGIGMDSLRIGSTVVNAAAYYGTLDPGFDPIYLPTVAAEEIYAHVSGAERDAADTTRWNLPCDTAISLTVSISGTSYAVNSATLVAARDIAGRTCWGNIVAWENGSVPESLGEVRLGTAFMNGVYTALYYSDSEMLVGLAGKPGSVNDKDLGPTGNNGHANGKLAGILIGSLLALLVLLLLGCYARNRNSFQSVWARAVRRQQRAQFNAMVRAQTLPPLPIVPVPVPAPAPVAPFAPLAPLPGRPFPPPPAPYGPYQPVPTTMGQPTFAPVTMGAGLAPAPPYVSPMPRRDMPAARPPQTADYVPPGRYVRQTASETSPSVDPPYVRHTASETTPSPLAPGGSAFVPSPAGGAALGAPRTDRRPKRASAAPRAVAWGDASAVRRAPSSSTSDGSVMPPVGQPLTFDTGQHGRLDDWAKRYAGSKGEEASSGSTPPAVPPPPTWVTKSANDMGFGAVQADHELGGDLGRMPKWKWGRTKYAAVPADAAAAAATTPPRSKGSRRSWFGSRHEGTSEREGLWAGQ
ncbi:hypothetical protein Q5752_006121 [Cryptotrichosporon argae]